MNIRETRPKAPGGIWYLDALVDAQAGTRVVSIISSPFQVGRSPERSLWLPFANISKKHAEFLVIQGGLLLRDLGSTNGTFVNQRRIEAETFLSVGDSVHFAQIGYRVGCWSACDTISTMSENPWQEALQAETDQRRETERELWNNQAKFHAILDAVGESILTFDSLGMITGCNQAATQLFGTTLDELVRTPVTALLPKLASVEDGLSFNPAGPLMEKPGRHKTIALRKLHGPCFVEIVTSKVQLTGDHSFVAVVRDITAEEQAKTDLQNASMVAEAACRAKGEFLANMSHEIRTPMTTILGYTEALLAEHQQSGTASDLDQSGNFRSLEIIHRNGNHLLGIVNNILDLAKFESGEAKLETIHYSPTELVDDVRCLTELLAQAKGLELDFQVAKNLPAAMLTDPTRLRQILVNLVGNAIKFTPQGFVRLNVSLDDESSVTPRIVFEVVDSGIGMNRAQVQSLFQPYRQGEASTSRRFGGTGLGLSISDRLTKLLGGQIEVESETGRGTSVRVNFPLVVPRTDEQDTQVNDFATLNTGERLEGLQILVAEDDPDIRSLLRVMLSKEGANVTLTNDGLQMLQTLSRAETENKSYDLIIVDMQMPVMDGATAIEHLRHSGFRIPVLTLTANLMLSDQANGAPVNGQARLSKPIRRDDLCEAIRQLCPAVASV